MIYIQSNKERTLPHHFDCACAMYGAMESDREFRLTSFEEVISGKFDHLIKTNVFVGSVEFMREVFKRAGKIDVRVPINTNRPCEIITLQEAIERTSTGKKLFIKPVEIKLFTGFVLDQSKYTCLGGLPYNTKVMAYEPFSSHIASEWRVYIYNKRICYSANYSGDITVHPDYKYVEEVIKENAKNQFPFSYTIDIAILTKSEPLKDDSMIDDNGGENVVVEFNDMWAIGNYGMPNDLYLECLTDRYFQIVKSN